MKPDALTLLDRDFVFSQRRLLVSRDFERAARERGFVIGSDDLDRLHAAGVLVPLYIARRSMRGITKAIRDAPDGAYPNLPQWDFAPDDVGLRSDRDGGYLTIGRVPPPRSSNKREVHGFRVQTRERLYSPYQLLIIPDLEALLATVRRRSARDAWARALLRHARRRIEDRRDLVILLSALEVHYYPRVVRSLSMSLLRGGTEAWQAADRDFDPVALHRWLGWTTDELQKAGEDLVFRAKTRDPMDSWSDLVGLVAPGRWKELRGDALIALELRIAGEVVLRFHEDLQKVHEAPAFPSIPPRAPHPLNWRLQTRAARLDQVLTSFGLSPYPAVLLVVEGQTEMAILPLVMDELRIRRDESHIRLVNARTESRDHTLLVSYAALPRLGPVENGVAEFIRPPTRYFIAVDGDRKFRTHADREAERRKWVDAIAAELPAAVKTPTGLAEVDTLVVLETWADGLDFERAHFSDDELAQAILATGLAPPATTASGVEAVLRQQRSAASAGGQLGSLGDIWKAWPRKPSKPTLALSMWPVLRRRLRSKRSRTGLGGIPVARVLMRADQLAIETPRRNVIFRVDDA